MMWLKTWQECRFRALLCAVMCISCCVIGLFGLIDDQPRSAVWPGYAQTLALMASLTAVSLAGSGINSQTVWGGFQGYHPSMFFLLSLPVSRRRALAIRTAMGAALALFFIVAAAAAFALLAPLRRVSVSLPAVGGAVLHISIAAWALFGIATFLTTLFDELTATALSYGLAGVVCGAFGALSSVARRIDPVAFIDGEWYRKTGDMGWTALAILIAVGFAFLAAAAYVVERKEY